MTAQVLEKTAGYIRRANQKAGGIIQREGWGKCSEGTSCIRIAYTTNLVLSKDYTNLGRPVRHLDRGLRALTWQRKAVKNLKHQPLISVVMPVYNANSDMAGRGYRLSTPSGLPELGVMHRRRCFHRGICPITFRAIRRTRLQDKAGL